MSRKKEDLLIIDIYPENNQWVYKVTKDSQILDSGTYPSLDEVESSAFVHLEGLDTGMYDINYLEKAGA